MWAILCIIINCFVVKRLMTHLIKDWNCCTPDRPCKVEMTGDCDEHHDCDGDMLCGKNNCGDDDLTGWEIVTTLRKIFNPQASLIAATGNVAHQTVIAPLLEWSVNF